MFPNSQFGMTAYDNEKDSCVREVNFIKSKIVIVKRTMYPHQKYA